MNESLDHLSVLKQRIQDGYVYLSGHQGDDATFRQGHDRLLRLTADYVRSLSAFVAAWDAESLTVERDRYAARLERGWQMEESPAVADQFTRVLRTYEVLCDAVRGVRTVEADGAGMLRLIETSRYQKRRAA